MKFPQVAILLNIIISIYLSGSQINENLSNTSNLWHRKEKLNRPFFNLWAPKCNRLLAKSNVKHHTLSAQQGRQETRNDKRKEKYYHNNNKDNDCDSDHLYYEPFQYSPSATFPFIRLNVDFVEINWNFLPLVNRSETLLLFFCSSYSLSTLSFTITNGSTFNALYV